MHARAASLVSAVAAKSWPQDRRVQEGIATYLACPRCAGGPETQLHRVWDCSANEGDAFDSSGHLGSRARSEAIDWPCFWFRGILSQQWMPYPIHDMSIIHHWGLEADFRLDGDDTEVLMIGDASGGRTRPIRSFVGWCARWSNSPPPRSALP